MKQRSIEYKARLKKYVFCLLLFTSFCMAKAQRNQLDYYIGHAIINSPLLNDYRNQIQSATYDSLLVRATYKAQVNGNSYNNYAPVIGGFGYDGAITNGGNVSALVGVTKQFVNRRSIGAQFDSIKFQKLSITNAAQISEQDLKRNVISQYIIAYGDLQQLLFFRETNALLVKEETILKKLTASNVYKQVDYLAFLVTLQQQNLQIKQLDIQFKNDYATLNYLSGITDTATVQLLDPNIQLNPLPEINHSVFFKKFEIDSLKLNNSKGLVDIAYRPRFNVFGDAGYNSTLVYQPYKNFGTSFGVSAIVPIYDGKQRKLQYAKIDISERTRQGYQSFYTSQYAQQIAQFMQQLKATDALIGDINEQLKYTDGLIKANAKLLGAGEVRIADYIIALNNYLTAKNLITQNTINRLQIINQINYWNR